MVTNHALQFNTAALTKFAVWLSHVPLSGRESRQRTKFLRLIQDNVTDFEKARVELARKHATADENGEPIIVKDGKGQRYDMTPEGLLFFGQELNELMKEKSIVDILPSTKDAIKAVRDIVLNTDEKFLGEDAVWYDIICEDFEKVTL